jgi:hypothetical protein
MFNASKVVVINDLTNYPVEFTLGATQATSTALLGDNLYIGGFLTYTSTGIPFSKITRVVGTRAKNGTKNKVNVTAATSTEVALTGTIPANTKVYLTIDIENNHYDSEYATKQIRQFKLRPFEINITTGETTATLLAKITNTINWAYRPRGVKNPNFTIVPPSTATVSGTYNDGTIFTGVLVSALTAPVKSYTSISDLDFECVDIYSKFKSFKVTGVDGQPSQYVTTFNPTTVTSQTDEYGTFAAISPRRNLLGMDWSNLYFSQGKGVQAQLPIPGNLYTEFAITMTMDRSDLHNFFPTTTAEQETLIIWVNQTALESTVDSLADYFDKATATEIWNGFVGATYTTGCTLAQFKTNA